MSEALKPLKGKPVKKAPSRIGTPVERDNQKLRRRVADLERELERCHAELSKLAASGVGAETLLARRFVAMELQHGDLASLLVASMRLQSSLKRQDILGAIREIVSNLVGVEEMALFEIDRLTLKLPLADGFGSHGGDLSEIRFGEGPIGSAASTGESFFHDVNEHGTSLDHQRCPRACIPLKVDGEVWGVIVIFRLLPHKERFVALDYQLFDLLSTRAGIALYCAKLADERLSIAKISA